MLFEGLQIELKDTAFIENALMSLAQAREILKWSYCFSYYIDVSKVKTRELFEYFQAEFEKVSEGLAMNLEKNLYMFIKKIKDGKTF